MKPTWANLEAAETDSPRDARWPALDAMADLGTVRGKRAHDGGSDSTAGTGDYRGLAPQRIHG